MCVGGVLGVGMYACVCVCARARARARVRTCLRRPASLSGLSAIVHIATRLSTAGLRVCVCVSVIPCLCVSLSV